VAIIFGPVLTREGGYAFEAWTPENGRSSGYVYRRIEDAHYARKAELRSPSEDHAGLAVACNTVDEFARATTALVHPPDTIAEPERQLAHRSVSVAEGMAVSPSSLVK
jgi:hypothetical protein